MSLQMQRLVKTITARRMHLKRKMRINGPGLRHNNLDNDFFSLCKQEKIIVHIPIDLRSIQLPKAAGFYLLFV